MHTSPWPKVAAHEQASCFSCHGDFGDRCYWFESGFPPGNGQYVQHCCKCGMATYYDIEKI
jgi:hypothetical protein